MFWEFFFWKYFLPCKCRLCQPWFYCCIGTSDSHCRYAKPALQHQLSEKQLTEDKKINPIGWKFIITNRVTLFQFVIKFIAFVRHFSVDTQIVENWFPISAALRVRLISCYLGKCCDRRWRVWWTSAWQSVSLCEGRNVTDIFIILW